MRRRLTVAMLLLVAVTLVITTLGSFFFIRRAAVATAQRELVAQARSISRAISDGEVTSRAGFRRALAIFNGAGAFADVQLVDLHPDGTVTGPVPRSLTVPQLDPAALAAGRQTVGDNGGLIVFTAVPTPMAGVTAYTPVLVVTRKVPNPANGLRYFGLVGAAALVVAAGVASGLARRFARPLVAAVSTTRRIARGELDATVPPGEHLYPEVAELVGAIDAMGASLARARDQERQFLLSVSHELRTPLTSIRGYADAVVDGTAEDPVAAATVIGGEARRLERLVHDLLDLARLDADRFTLELEPVDGAAVARNVVDGFRPRAAELGLELVSAPGSGGPVWVRADHDRLGQIVANLVENASGFAEHRIVVGADVVGSTPAIWVVDDGRGIPADELSRVFERHVTSDRGGRRRGGSGLGLAIVSELAAAMGAVVRAESPVAEGRGTRMVVWLRPGGDPPGGEVTGPGT